MAKTAPVQKLSFKNCISKIIRTRKRDYFKEKSIKDSYINIFPGLGFLEDIFQFLAVTSHNTFSKRVTKSVSNNRQHTILAITTHKPLCPQKS